MPAGTSETRPAVHLGQLADDGRLRVRVNVAHAGRYAVQYFVDYPKSAGLLETRVDGHRLPDVHTPARPDDFGVYGNTASFRLTAGWHTFDLAAPDVPSFASADLVDARAIVD